MAWSNVDAPNVPIKKGSKITKVMAEVGDRNPLGSLGTVVGSIGPFKVPGVTSMYSYFIEWDRVPGIFVSCIESKVRAATP